jgi:hypothetical protein
MKGEQGTDAARTAEQSGRRDEAEGVERAVEGHRAGDGPAKPHGDALKDGSGTRHGVTERDERPEVDRDA